MPSHFLCHILSITYQVCLIAAQGTWNILTIKRSNGSNILEHLGLDFVLFVT